MLRTRVKLVQFVLRLQFAKWQFYLPSALANCGEIVGKTLLWATSGVLVGVVLIAVDDAEHLSVS